MTFMRALVAIVAVATAYAVAAWMCCQPHGFRTASDADLMRLVARPCLVAVFGVVGIVSRSVFDRLQAHPDKPVRLGRVLRETARSKQFYLALLISPIVIITFYGTLERIQSLGLLAVLSYQNGFFFHAIFDRRKAEVQ
jgi:hypothetical protein